MILEKYLSRLFEMKVYDKDKWHTDKKGTSAHIGVMMDWLKKNGCLTKEGEESYKEDKTGVIHERMLKPKCKKIMDKCYDSWVKTINYKKKPDIKAFDKCARGK